MFANKLVRFTKVAVLDAILYKIDGFIACANVFKAVYLVADFTTVVDTHVVPQSAIDISLPIMLA